jgi:transcription antitermination factor NusG
METQTSRTELTTRHSSTEVDTHLVTASQQLSVSWFAAYTHSHHEKRVASHFDQRRIETFLPLYATRHRWKNGCSKELALPLFPNYVFVRIDPRQRVRVLEVPGVVALVGSGRALAPLPDFEIETLRCGLRQRKIEPHPYLVLGERVRIKGGAMLGMEGVLVRKKNNLRVVIALDAILQSVAVEVDADDLEPAANFPARARVATNFQGRR